MSTTAQDPDTQARHGHKIEIIINARPVAVTEHKLTFDDVVELSGLPTGPNIVFTVTYRKADGKPHKGSMVQGGDPVKVKDGTIFNVTFTDRS